MTFDPQTQAYQYVSGDIDREGKVEDLIAALVQIQLTAPEEFQDGLQYMIDTNEYDFEISFFYARPKTQAELDLAAQQKTYAENYRRQQYLKLKAEFEGGDND